MALIALSPRDASVLIVEDNPDDAIITTRALKKFGIKHIYHATTAEDALGFLARQRCDVILADYHLPGMNGLRLLTKLREVTPDARVIFVTGARDEKVAVEALKNGAADYVSKDEWQTSGIINSLQSVLRGSIDFKAARRQTQLAAGTNGVEVALAEADWLISPSSQDPANFVLSIVTSDDADTPDARDAVVRYLKACSPSGSFDREEQSLISILVGRGASARDVVVLFRAALRAIEIECAPDEPAFAIRPTACLAGILARLTEEYQCQLSLQAATRTAA